MLEAYEYFWKNAINFKDRTTRKDYWLVVLVNLLFMGVMVVIFSLFEGENTNFNRQQPIAFAVLGLMALYQLAIIIPSLALVIRRLNDAGIPKWLIALPIIPYLGSLVLVILTLLPSKVQLDN